MFRMPNRQFEFVCSFVLIGLGFQANPAFCQSLVPGKPCPPLPKNTPIVITQVHTPRRGVVPEPPPPVPETSEPKSVAKPISSKPYYPDPVPPPAPMPEPKANRLSVPSSLYPDVPKPVKNPNYKKVPVPDPNISPERLKELFDKETVSENPETYVAPVPVPDPLPNPAPLVPASGEKIINPPDQETIPQEPKTPPTVPLKTLEPPFTPKAKPRVVPIPVSKKPDSTSPWVVRIEVTDKGTHLVAKGKETEFRVLCQHLKMESPAGTIQAEGNIHLSVVGIQINCDRLMLSWKDDWVRMEGNVNLIASNANNQGVEMKGKELLLRLTTLSSLGERETDSGIRRTSFPPPRIQETQEPDLGNVPVRNSPPPVPKKLPSFYPPTSKIN